MDEKTYLAIAIWLTNRTETCLKHRFGDSHRDVPPNHVNEPTDAFPWHEREN